MPAPTLVPSERVLEMAQSLEAPLHLFVHEPEGLRRTDCMSRVLDVGRPRHRRLLVETPTAGTAPYPLHVGDEVEFFFEVDGVGYAFGGPVRERARFALNERTQIPALQLDYPEELLKIQRRAYYRALAAPDEPVPVRLRPLQAGESADDRAFATDFPYLGRMYNISGAGIAVAFEGGFPFAARIDQRFTLKFRLSREDVNDIVLDTRLRAISPAEHGRPPILRFAWVECDENDELTGPFAERIFKYVADRQRQMLHERHDLLRRRR